MADLVAFGAWRKCHCKPKIAKLEKGNCNYLICCIWDWGQGFLNTQGAKVKTVNCEFPKTFGGGENISSRESTYSDRLKLSMQ